ncbi:MAG: chorismate-binding protein [Chlorobi bacterium]|nr:chorismate-binding protein [Chlorobiota bacterium]
MQNSGNSESVDSWVFYRRPVTSQIVHIAGNARVINDNDWINNSGFVVAPFDVNNHKTYFIDTGRREVVHSEYEVSELVRENLRIPQSHILTKPWRDIHKREYVSLIKQVKREIEDTELDKVVLSRVINVEGIRPYHAVKMFIELCARYPNAFVYVYYIPDIGMWLGATPETLITGKEGVFRIVSLAGTAWWQPELSFNQLWGEKELVEQQIVTDYIRNVIVETGIDNYEMRGPETVKSGKLSHIRTTFRFKKDNMNLIAELVNKLHPTPAVCGLPKDKAQKIIAEVERYDRTYYTGYLGSVCEDGFGLYVNLRCLQFTNNGVQLFVGGGITKDSDPFLEWEETDMKARTLLDVIK